MNLSREKIIKLISVIEKEYKLYQSEYAIVEKRVELIKANEVQELNQLIKEERELSETIALAEKERIAIVNEYGAKLTLKELAYELDEEDLRDKLLNLRDKLISILEEIRVKNELSSQLIDVSSKMLDTILKEAAGEKELGYNKFKKKSSLVNNNLLNTRG